MAITQNDPQKLLILGCGDIGQRLAQQLAPRGYRIVGVRRSPQADLPHLQYQIADVTRAGAIDHILAQHLDVIVISMTPDERSDAGYALAYVHTCRQLLVTLERTRQQPRLLVFVSSTGVYTQQDGSWVDESSPTEPTHFSGRRLLEAEQLISQSGFPHCIVRPSGIYGPGRYRLIEQVRQQQASPSQHFTNRIHAEDVAGAISHLVEYSHHHPIATLYLASDMAPAPMADVVHWLAGQMGIRDPFSVNTSHGQGNKRINNQRLLNSGFKFRYPDYRQGYAELLHNLGF